MLNLHRDKKSQGVNRGEMGRSLVTTGRMVMMRSIGYKYVIRWYILVVFNLGILVHANANIGVSVEPVSPCRVVVLKGIRWDEITPSSERSLFFATSSFRLVGSVMQYSH